MCKVCPSRDIVSVKAENSECWEDEIEADNQEFTVQGLEN